MDIENQKDSVSTGSHDEKRSDTSSSLNIDISEQIKETNYYKGWTISTSEEFEKMLKNCMKRADEHSKCCKYYSAWNRYITYPSIILTTLVSILTTYNINPENNLQNIISYTVVGLSGVNTLMTSLSSFWDYSNRASKHNSTSLQYNELARQIRTELFLPLEERNSVKYNFDIFSLLLQNIESNSPPC